MKLQILSDGSMVLDGDAAGLAEFAKAMRVSTTVATSVDTTVATTVESNTIAPVESKSGVVDRSLPKETRRKQHVKFAAEAKLLLAVSPDKPRASLEISKISGLGITQVNNLLERMRTKAAVSDDGSEPRRWIRLVDPVFEESPIKPESNIAVKPESTPSSTPVVKGTNTKFILDLCADWTRRTVILSRAKTAGLNADSISAQLPILADRGWLEGRTAEDGRVEYRTKPANSTVP